MTGLPGGLCIFFFWGGGREGSGTFRGKHSVEDYYLHKNGIIFWGSSQLGGGGTCLQEALNDLTKPG